VKLASITFLSFALSYWIYYLDFITEGKLAAVLITPSLGVPNWSVIYIINIAPSTSFLAPLLGRKKTSARGVSHTQSFTFFILLLYFIFACIVLSKIQKNSFLYSCFYLLALVLLEGVLLKTPSCVTLLAPKTVILSALLLRHLLLRQIFMRSNLL
jgi:hypothetical protein